MPSALREGRKTQARRIYREKQVVFRRYYVKETWNYFDPDPAGENAIAIPPERFFNRAPWVGCQGSRLIYWTSVYAADGPLYHPKDGLKDGKTLWRPSSNMPRWAARYFIEVDDVRFGKLQDITEEDARAEGMDWTAPRFYDGKNHGEDREDPRVVGYGPAPCDSRFARDNFARKWDKTNGKRATWESNPSVVVIVFHLLPPEKKDI
jgi:hypothetical protein